MERAGVHLYHYALDSRLDLANSWLRIAYDNRSKKEPDCPRPTEADIIYHASLGVLERALRFEVDWALVVSGMWFHPDAMVMLRRAGIKVAFLYTEGPYSDARALPFAECADAVWVNELACLPTFRARNPNTYYWQHAIDPAKHHPGPGPADETALSHDVVFVGTGFIERCETLGAVDWSGIDFGLYGTWDLLGSRHRLRKHLRARVVDNAHTAALYRRARVGLNLHRTSVEFGRDVEHVTGAESMGPRCYELAATGCFFVTDYRREVSDVFGDVVPTFATAGELEELLRYYLAHDEERRERAGHLPALAAPHTFDARVAEMMEVLGRL